MNRTNMRNVYSTAVATALLLLFSAQELLAQDTLKTDVIDVIKVYNPTLSDAIKVKVLPNPEIPEFKPPVIIYNNISNSRISLTPSYSVAKPIVLGSSALPKLKNNYLRLGYGNYNAPLAELYLNSLRSRSYHFNFFYKHYSAKGDEDFNNFSDNQTGAEVKRFFKKSTLSFNAGYQNNKYRPYGLPDSLSDKNSIWYTGVNKISLNTFSMAGRVNNVQRDSSLFKYDVGFKYYLFGINRLQFSDENQFIMDGHFSKMFNGATAELYTAFDAIVDVFNRSYFHFDPSYLMPLDEKMTLKLGFNTVYFSTNDSNLNNKFYFYPNTELTYRLMPEKLSAFAGLKGNIIRNSQRSLLLENRFALGNNSLANSSNSLEFFIGLKGSLSPRTGFQLRFSAQNLKNLYYFVNDVSASSFGSKFRLLYYNTRLSTLSAELNYQLSEKMRLLAVANFYGYDVGGLDKAIQRPTAELKLNGTYNIGNKIYLKADVFAMNRRYALLYNPSPLLAPFPAYEKMKGWLDFNFGGEYRYGKTSSFFLNINNITSNRYQRWYNYPVYGINLQAGLTLTF